MQTFFQVIDLLVDTNKKLIDGEIDINTAKQVAQNTQVYINGAKVMLDAMRLAGVKESDFFFPKDVIGTIKEEEYTAELTKGFDLIEKNSDCEAVTRSDVSLVTGHSTKGADVIETKRVVEKQLTAPILKGMYRITVEESERFHKWLERHAVFTLHDLNSSDIFMYQKWNDEGKK